MKNPENLLSRITIDPKVMVGKPTIRGSRMTVEHILKALAGGLTFADLVEDYPFLEEEDLLACFFYASKVVEMKPVRRRRKPSPSPAERQKMLDFIMSFQNENPSFGDAAEWQRRERAAERELPWAA